MESHDHDSDSQTFHWRYAEFDDSNFQIHGRTLFFLILLISLILFITFLYIYTRWLCSFSSEDSSTLQLAEAHAPPQSLPLSQGLDPSRISRMPITLHQAVSIGCETECSICLGIFIDGEKVKVLPDCRHCYHSECVDKWLSDQSTCPLCRSSLRIVSIV